MATRGSSRARAVSITARASSRPRKCFGTRIGMLEAGTSTWVRIPGPAISAVAPPVSTPRLVQFLPALPVRVRPSASRSSIRHTVHCSWFRPNRTRSIVMMSVGRLLLAIQFLTCLSLTPTSPAKVAFFHGSPCLSDPGGRVPRRKCQSSKSPKLNPLGGSSTSGEGMAGPFPKISIERKTTSGHLVSLVGRHNPAEPKPTAELYHVENGNDRTTYHLTIRHILDFQG